MCGIAGWIGDVGADETTLRAMCDALQHRGPDDWGVYIEPGRVGLGFRRLSIIDLESGHQPLFGEDRATVATCNGEIYNFLELRADLEARGHRFATRSDSETIVHLYESHGPDFLHRLQGMFAVALWDKKTKTLLLARDRLGVKPLYWAPIGDGLLYASEPAAIFASGMIDPAPDPPALLEYLTLQYVPPPRTGFAGLQKLRPGEVLRAGRSGTEVKRYWRLLPDPTPEKVSEEEALDALDALLEDATASRLIADVPLGAFLSGGIDSSLIVSYMAERLPNVATFGIDFPDDQFSEGAHARRVAEIYGTDHEEFVVEPGMVPRIGDLIGYLGEPFADSSCIPTFLLSEMTRRHVTVALSGDGGDEAFGGYVRYRIAATADRLDPWAPRVARSVRAAIPDALLSRLPRVHRGLDAVGRSAHDRYSAMVTHFSPERLVRLCRPAFLETAGGPRAAWDGVLRLPEVPGVSRYLALDTETYLPGDVLLKVDRMSMAHNLEVRSPFLDYRVHEFAARLPGSLKLHRTTTKFLLRRLALRRGLPKDLVRRPKQGFGVPVGRWLREDLRPWMRDVLLDPEGATSAYFCPGAVATLVDQHTSGTVDHTSRLWNLLVLELWHQHWMNGGRG